MTLHKKLAAVFVAFALSFAICIPALAADTGFSDVPADAYYAEAVTYCQEHGLMNGTSDTTFSPNNVITRAQLTAILWRQAGSPAAGAGAFSDVPADTYYTTAAGWANERSIVTGYGDGTFRPATPVTRAQFSAILWRAQGSPAANSRSAFADQSEIPSYAVDAVSWAAEQGIVNGKEGNRFDPNGAATRAQAAAILYRYATLNSQSSRPETPSDPASGGEGTAITITVGNTVIPAILNDSAPARDLISRLPLTVSMTRGSADYYAALREALDYTESDIHSGWHNGDIGFDGTYLTMFHSGEETSSSHNNQMTLGRVSDLSLLDELGSSIQATFALASAQPEVPSTTAHRTLVVYYSLSQRTKGVAELLQAKTDGDIYELVPAEPYTGGNSAISQRAREEVESGNYPSLSGTLPDLTQYDTILIGGPVWSGTMASPLYTYLSESDFTGKTVAPFWTDQGTPGDYTHDFTNAVQNAARVTEFLQLTNTTSISAEDMSQHLDTWLEAVLE